MTVAAGRLEVETPDHVVLRYDLAGAGNRGFAAVLDFLVATVIALTSIVLLGVGGALLGVAGALSEASFFFLGGFTLIVTAVLIWAYFILLEWLWNGQTIGKRAFRLRVINEDGSPAQFTAVLIRNLLRLVDFLPALYGLGVLVIVLSPKSQRLGDLAAGTYVVRAPRPQVDWFSLRTVTPLGAGVTAETRRMPGEAQRLVREFVARESQLTPTERARIAALIAAKLRTYTVEDLGPLSDIDLIHAIARSLRATAETRR
ncbi:MAG: RDD family protein [Chloroflexi bacterium]|nr:MAG: RDD family protein [Chloroflexota bacterium]